MTNKKITLELEGQNGNAFSLLARFRKQAQREKWTTLEIDDVLEEAQKGDYDHLLQTLLAHTE